jgi:Holliday junction resolvasome RuvABC endonuclease subunit
MRVLALDQSLKVTGWSVYEDNKLIDYGTFSISPSKPIEQRLAQVQQELNELVHKYEEFDFVVLEGCQLQMGNVETFRKLCYVQAVIIEWCYFNNIKYDIYSPSHWRSIIKNNYQVSFGRKRAEQKEAAVNFVSEHFNISPTEDEADAILIGLSYWSEVKERAF